MSLASLRTSFEYLEALIRQPKERLKSHEQYYEQIFKSYEELQLSRYKLSEEGKCTEHYNRWAGYCITYCKNLQNIIDNTDVEEEPQEGTKASNNRNKFLMLHSGMSLAEERMILRNRGKQEQPKIDKLEKNGIDLKAFNREFCNIQRYIPKINNKKHVHNLLSRLKEANKLREKARNNGAIVGNSTTTHESIEDSKNIVREILDKLIKELEKQREETNNILQDTRIMKQEYTKKMRRILERREWVWEKWDGERKHKLKLMNMHAYDELNYFFPISQRWIH